MVGQRAQKLSAQLRATAACIAGFVDSVQAVSDYANNLKGAARDMGVCMTRVCMRERALEHRLRAVADALADETAVSIQQRAAYWKQRTADLDKNAAKHVKKVGVLFVGIFSEFLPPSALFMVDFCSMNALFQLVDGHTLVQTILSDLSQGADNAWRQCLTNATRAYRSGDSGEDGGLSTRATTPGSSFSHVANMVVMLFRYTTNHCGITPHTFIPPKPPLQRRPSDKSITKVRYTPPPEIPASHQQNANHQSQGPPPSYRSVGGSQFDLNLAPSGRVQRPQSFTGELRTTFASTPTFCTAPTYRTGSSSCSSSDAASSAALIAETLQQIDQLGSDLESYCVAADQQQPQHQQQQQQQQHLAVTHRVHSEYAALRTTTNGCDKPLPSTNGHGPTVGTGSAVQNGVRIRAESASRPPPPARRSSTI
ncbi:IMD domain-containing protein, partial [Trichostrongylus colubriformis]